MKFQETLKEFEEQIRIAVIRYGFDGVFMTLKDYALKHFILPSPKRTVAIVTMILKEYAIKQQKNEENQASSNLADIAYWKEVRQHLQTLLNAIEEM